MRADGRASRAGASGEASGEMIENGSGEMIWIRCLLIALVSATLAAAPARAAGTFASGRHEGRSYALFTPSTPPAGPPVVPLHGCWHTPEGFGLATPLNDLAPRRRPVGASPAPTLREIAY